MFPCKLLSNYSVLNVYCSFTCLFFPHSSNQPLDQVWLGLDHNSQHYNLNALVVPGSGPNLLGRDWLSVLKLSWAEVHQMDRDDFLEPYQAALSEGLGALKGGHC